MLETSSGMPGGLGISCQVTKNSGLIANQGVMRASYDTPPASANPLGLEARS